MKFALQPRKSIFRFPALALLLILTSTNLIAQDELIEMPAEFKIKIESGKNTIKLTCLQGCNWKELHYRTTNVNILQAVNRFGMIDLNLREVVQSEDVNDFLFIIETEANSIKLKGLEGTAWKTLILDCYRLVCVRLIDSYGVVRPVQ